MSYEHKQRAGFMLYHEDLAYLCLLRAGEIRTIIRDLTALSTALAHGQAEPEAPELEGVAAITSANMRLKLIRDHEKYVETCMSRRHSPVKSRLSALDKTTYVDLSDPTVTQTQTKSETVTVAKPDGPAAAGEFTPPTADEVDLFCKEAGINIDSSRFCDFYASKGWMVGAQPMKDWKAAARNWARRDGQAAQGANVVEHVKVLEQQQYTQRTYENNTDTLDAMMEEFLRNKPVQSAS